MRKNLDATKGEVRPVADFVSARSAAKSLRITARTLEKLVERHNLTIRQVPGNRRKWLLRSEVERLAAASIRQGQGGAE